MRPAPRRSPPAGNAAATTPSKPSPPRTASTSRAAAGLRLSAPELLRPAQHRGRGLCRAAQARAMLARKRFGDRRKRACTEVVAAQKASEALKKINLPDHDETVLKWLSFRCWRESCCCRRRLGPVRATGSTAVEAQAGTGKRDKKQGRPKYRRQATPTKLFRQAGGACPRRRLTLHLTRTNSTSNSPIRCSAEGLMITTTIDWTGVPATDWPTSPVPPYIVEVSAAATRSACGSSLRW